MHFSAELFSVIYLTYLQDLELLNWKDDVAKAQPEPGDSRKTAHSPYKQEVK